MAYLEFCQTACEKGDVGVGRVDHEISVFHADAAVALGDACGRIGEGRGGSDGVCEGCTMAGGGVCLGEGGGRREDEGVSWRGHVESLIYLVDGV